jgi:hypothetical protein
VGYYESAESGGNDEVIVGVEGFVATMSASDAWPAIQAIVPSDAATPVRARLQSVSCATADSCVAVGSYEAEDGNTHALIETIKQ